MVARIRFFALPIRALPTVDVSGQIVYKMKAEIIVALKKVLETQKIFSFR